ncbi:unnamed protein product [Symbiodinium sp. CCMP2456]|nr:unnamed protein product [Symbiodinium sp. CCMP2456]
MLARVLIPAESSGLGPCRYLGYGGSPGRALDVAKVVLQRLPKASLLEVHCPAREAPALQRLASEEPRLRLPSVDAQGKGRTDSAAPRFLHSLVTSAEEECQLPLRGVLLDLRGLVLPSWSAAWLRKATQQELAKLFQQHGEQEDDLLWARFAQVLEVQKQVCGLQANSDIAGLFRRVAELLKDPAGPAADGALNALRAALRKEQAVVQDGLRVVLDHLEVGARCILLSDRRDFCIGIRRFLRENEDVDEDLVADWRPHKVASLFPLSQNAEQPWCVAEVTHSAVNPMSAAANLAAKEVFVIEKRLRSSQPREPVEGSCLVLQEHLAVRCPFAVTSVLGLSGA